MKVLGWIVGALVVLLALLALSGSELRLHRPVLAVDCCDGKCYGNTWCNTTTCKCQGGANQRDAREARDGGTEPRTGLYQADWISPSWPRPFDPAER